MNILIYGDYLLIKPQGLSNFISKIFKSDFNSIIDKEYPIQDSQLAIIEKFENEKLHVRLVGELKLRKINPDDVIKVVEPRDYDIINKSLPEKNKKPLEIKNIITGLFITIGIIGILDKLVPPALLSHKITVPNIFIILLVINTMIILIYSEINFGKKEKRYEKDLLAFKHKYKIAT